MNAASRDGRGPGTRREQDSGLVYQTVMEIMGSAGIRSTSRTRC